MHNILKYFFQIQEQEQEQEQEQIQKSRANVFASLKS